MTHEQEYQRSEKGIGDLIQEVDTAITPLIDSIDIQAISKHNVGYMRYGTDKFRYFVESEKNRFIKALDIILRDRRQGSYVISDASSHTCQLHCLCWDITSEL